MAGRRKGWRRLNPHRRAKAKAQKRAGISGPSSPQALQGDSSATDSAHVQVPISDAGTPPGGHGLDSAGGPGGEVQLFQHGHQKRPRSERGDSGLPMIKEQRLIERAIKNNWIERSKPWALTEKGSYFANLLKTEGELSVEDTLVSKVLIGANSGDHRVEQIAVRSGVAMKGQNLSDEHHRERMEFHERALAARIAASQQAARGGIGVAVSMGGTQAGGVDGAAGDVSNRVCIFIPHNGRDDVPGLVSAASLEGLTDFSADGIMSGAFPGELPPVGDEKEFRDLDGELGSELLEE